MPMPDPFPGFTQGEPLTGDQIDRLVAARFAGWSPPGEFQYGGGVVVVHPYVLEPIVLEADRHPNSVWSERWIDGRLEVRLRGVLVVTDPALRYDEVRLRREEVLTP